MLGIPAPKPRQRLPGALLRVPPDLSMVLKHPATAGATRPRGKMIGFPQAKVLFEEEKTTSALHTRIFTGEEGNCSHNSTAALFLIRKRQPILVLAGKRLKNSCQFFKWESLFLQGNQESPRVSQMLKLRQISLQATGSMATSSLCYCEGGEENRSPVPKDGAEAIRNHARNAMLLRDVHI